MKLINISNLIILTSTIIIAISIKSSSASNILFYFGLVSPSHVSSIWPVIEVLVNSGHNITLLTSFKPHNLDGSKVHLVYVAEINDVLKHHWGEESDLLATRSQGRKMELWDKIMPIGLDVCRGVLSSPSTQNLLHNTAFDLIVVDSAYNECGMGLAVYVYQAPFILYSAFSINPNYYDQYGLPSDSSTIPDVHHTFKLPMNFYAKLISTIWPVVIGWYRFNYYYYPALTQIFEEKLNLDVVPSFDRITSKASLVLIGSHYSNDYVKCFPPLFVQIAGIGINNETKPLPNELETFVSKPGSDGFIYISFGTTVNVKDNVELRDKLYGAIRQFPSIQFIWKCEVDVLSTSNNGVPSNIYFSNWLPQQDLLSHRRIKAFVTHGGINGLHEATYHAVPMIVFPVWADQDYNAQVIQFKGLGIPMEITDFTQEELEKNIKVLLNDNEYLDRVRRASTAFKDRPMKPLDTAVWWIEYVLRTKDTSFLMPAAATQSWYEHRLLDVWAFIFTVLLAGFSLFGFVIYKLMSLLTFKFKSNRVNHANDAIKSKTN